MNRWSIFKTKNFLSKVHLILHISADLLKTYTDEDFQAFIICLLLAKDEFISRNSISDLIDLLNNIRVSLSLVPVAGSSESVNLEQYLNNDTRHFICSRNGCVSFISQNAMDSVFLAFKDLFKLKKILFDLLLVNRRFLVRYCRTAEYKEKKNELCVHLSPCQTKLFLFCLGSDIIDHLVLEDKTKNAIVCKRCKETKLYSFLIAYMYLLGYFFSFLESMGIMKQKILIYTTNCNLVVSVLFFNFYFSFKIWKAMVLAILPMIFCFIVRQWCLKLSILYISH